ncbi:MULTISPECIES: hypothetical protein [unclassified Agrococcus]|uniref:hypothetical protein n=1 Tax=unclassified Agrococcus TaxID=2615065 RepID=UPI00361B775A
MDQNAQQTMLAQAMRELDAARVRVTHLEQVVDGLTGLLGLSDPDQRHATLSRMRHAEEAPRPRDAVLEVLSSRPGLPMTAREVYDTLRGRGLVDSTKKSGIAAYDMALRRLADETDSNVRRDEEKNTYTFRPSRGTYVSIDGLARDQLAAAVAERHERSTRSSSASNGRQSPGTSGIKMWEDRM